MIELHLKKPDPKTGRLKTAFRGSLFHYLWLEAVSAYKPHSKKVERASAMVVAFGILYGGCVNHVESHSVGLAWNEVTGNVWVQRPGFHLTSPFTVVSEIDTRPTRICIHGSRRTFSCKLVRFNPEGFREFIATEGHRYYWWSNRFSFNSGHDEEYRGMRNVLRGYAYSGSTYPFLTVEAQ